MVETKYLRAVQTGLSRKFDKAWAGPYTVAELVSPNAVRVTDYPDHWKIHPVINVSRVRPYVDGEERFPGRTNPGGTPEPEFEVSPPLFTTVEAFVARRRDPEDRRIRQVLVRWKDSHEDTWETELFLREACKAAHGDYARFDELYESI